MCRCLSELWLSCLENFIEYTNPINISIVDLHLICINIWKWFTSTSVNHQNRIEIYSRYKTITVKIVYSRSVLHKRVKCTGGGGGAFATWMAMHPHPKKCQRGVFFKHTCTASTFFLKRGYFFTFNITLGVPRNKILELYIQNAI